MQKSLVLDNNKIPIYVKKKDTDTIVYFNTQLEVVIGERWYNKTIT